MQMHQSVKYLSHHAAEPPLLPGVTRYPEIDEPIRVVEDRKSTSG
jgi:hypothetical protein